MRAFNWPLMDFSVLCPMPGNFLCTFARTAAATGFPLDRARAFLACEASGIGYDPLPGAFPGTAKLPFGIFFLAAAVSFN